MALVFKQNCNWRFLTARRAEAFRGLPRRVERWAGRYDQLDTFLSQKTLGSQLSGGYIMDRDIDDTAPEATCDLIVGLPPDFQNALAENHIGIRTASISATVGISTIWDGVEEVDAVRSVSYYAPETHYHYFSSTMPQGGRYDLVLTNLQPVLIRSVISVQGTVPMDAMLDEDPHPNRGQSYSKTYGGANAPGALVSALSMPAEDRLISHSSRSIPGTPWYECTDVVSRELIGDA